MGPEGFLDSFAGIVAVTGLFATPIISILILAIILTTGMNKRHIERMKMIEAGLIPPAPRRSHNWYPLLITGAILLAFGLALFIAGLRSGDDGVEPGLIFGLTGLAMLGCFAYIRRTRPQVPEPEGHPTPPPQLPAP